MLQRPDSFPKSFHLQNWTRSFPTLTLKTVEQHFHLLALIRNRKHNMKKTELLLLIKKKKSIFWERGVMGKVSQWTGLSQTQVPRIHLGNIQLSLSLCKRLCTEGSLWQPLQDVLRWAYGWLTPFAATSIQVLDTQTQTGQPQNKQPLT